jgi:hypothetical protein
VPDSTARQFLRRKLVEGPNNVLPWSANFEFQMYFVKLTSKFEKIGLLDDPGRPGIKSHIDFNGLGLRLQKRNPDLVASGLHISGSLKILLFCLLFHRDSRLADGQKSISLSI